MHAYVCMHKCAPHPLLYINFHYLKAVKFVQALVECEGDSIDLSGDMGAVGRVVIPDGSSGNHDMYLDLKGIFLLRVLKISYILLCISPILLEDF